MAFVQIIEVQAEDEAVLREHLSAWDAEQADLAPGYQGSRLLADQDTPGRYVVVVDFSSREEAQQNDQRPETAAWADKLRGVVTGEPTFRNLEARYTTTEA